MDFISDKNSLPLWIDPSNFDKVIINILSNAFKFTPENGNISISITSDDNNAEIRICDTGIGIKEDEKDRIFERFYQIRNNVNNSNVGTGIGLHLTRSLVELHHGSVSFQNNSNGQGSCFIIQLPLGCSHLTNEEMNTDSLEQDITYHKEPGKAREFNNYFTVLPIKGIIDNDTCIKDTYQKDRMLDTYNKILKRNQVKEVIDYGRKENYVIRN